MSANTNSSVIADQANAITSGITTQRNGMSRSNNGLDDAVISTVMGHGLDAGKPDAGQLRAFIRDDAMLKSLIEDNPQAKSIIERVTQLGATISDKRNEAVVAECAKQTEAHIAVPLRAEALTLRTSVNDTQQKTQQLQTAAKRAVNKMIATRVDAIIEYTCDVNRIGADIKSMSKITAQIEGVDQDVKTIMDDASLDNLDKADKIYKYGGLKKQMTTIRSEMHDVLVAHINGIKDNFVDSYSKGSKRGKGKGSSGGSSEPEERRWQRAYGKCE